MLRTRVGYSGGTKKSPSYYSLGDQTETIAIDYDPKVISYEDLLNRFWNAHHCGSGFGGRQYMNAVFYHNPEQKALAEKTRAEAAGRVGLSITEVKTGIFPATQFTYAENYHQKYSLTRHKKVRKFLSETYPTTKAFADSMVASRLNAWLGSGYTRDRKHLEAELESYGLPEEIKSYVLKNVRG